MKSPPIVTKALKVNSVRGCHPPTLVHREARSGEVLDLVSQKAGPGAFLIDVMYGWSGSYPARCDGDAS